MVNIGPVWMWQLICFGILGFGALIGMFIKTLGGIYFWVLNLVSVGFLAALTSTIVTPLANWLNSKFSSILGSATELSDATIIFSTIVATILLYFVWILVSNIILVSVYVPVLRKRFKKIKINRPVDYLLGSFLGFLVSAIFMYFIANLLSTDVFYNNTNFKQNFNTILKSNTDESSTYKNKIRPSAIGNMYSWLPLWSIQVSGNSLIALFWTIAPVVNTGTSTGFADLIANPNLANNINNVLNQLPNDSKNSLVNEVTGSILGELQKEAENQQQNNPSLPIFCWETNDSACPAGQIGMNAAYENWAMDKTDKRLSGPIIQNLMQTTPSQGDVSSLNYVFNRIYTFANSTSLDGAFKSILTDGNKFYNTLFNFYQLGKIAPGASNLVAFNALIGTYVKGLTVINPGAADPILENNYSQISHWF